MSHLEVIPAFLKGVVGILIGISKGVMLVLPFPKVFVIIIKIQMN